MTNDSNEEDFIYEDGEAFCEEESPYNNENEDADEDKDDVDDLVNVLGRFDWVDPNISASLQDFLAYPSEMPLYKAWFKYEEGKCDDVKSKFLAAEVEIPPGPQHLKFIIFANPSMQYSISKMLQFLHPSITISELIDICNCFRDTHKYFGMTNYNSHKISYFIYSQDMKVQNTCRNELHQTSAESFDCVIYLAGEEIILPYPIIDWFFPIQKQAQKWTVPGPEKIAEALPVLLIFNFEGFEMNEMAVCHLFKMSQFYSKNAVGESMEFKINTQATSRVYRLRNINKEGLNIEEAMMWAMNKIKILRAC